jgi:hypothetical protein
MRKNLVTSVVAEVPAVHQRNRGAVSQVLPNSGGQLEPALLLPAQFDQTAQVGGRNDAGRPGVAEAPRRRVRRGRLGVQVGGRRGEVLLDGPPTLGSDRFKQVLDAHEPHHAMQVGNEAEDHTTVLTLRSGPRPALVASGLVIVIGLSLALLFALGTPWRGSITVSGQPIDVVAHDLSTGYFHR